MMQKDLWIDTRLTKEEIKFLNDAISEDKKKSHSKKLSGNISYSAVIEDKNNWFYESALKRLTERMFYWDWNNFSKYQIEKDESQLPEFEMYRFWINYQRQHDFNPLHAHLGLFSFVVFMKIPTHWEKQHSFPHFDVPSASDFAFVWSEKDSELCTTINFKLSPEDEGRILFFPAFLHHQVYPFYECEEERITIAGNIRLCDPNRLKVQEIPVDEYEEKEYALKILENSVRVTKEELKQMKKEREKV